MLIRLVKEAIEEDFGLKIDILIRDQSNFSVLRDALPDHWGKDKLMKCDVILLSEVIDNDFILTELVIKPDIDTVFYVPGAVV